MFFSLNPIKYVEKVRDMFAPEQHPKVTYRTFEIIHFRAVQHAEISFRRSNLALLLGINESGKTTLLKSIESFDFRNDPAESSEREKFYRSIRNKQDVRSNKAAEIHATIELDGNFNEATLKSHFKNHPRFPDLDSDQWQQALNTLEKAEAIKIRRVFPFSEGQPGNWYYDFTDKKVFNDSELDHELLCLLVSLSPFIVYFEDFKDRIPEQIYIDHKSPGYHATWADIIEGIFYHTDDRYNLQMFQRFYTSNAEAQDDAQTVLNRVNKTINRIFTEKWKNLSGVQDIEKAVVTYTHHREKAKRYFQIKIVDDDGTTYSVDERSKGALWYLSFLLKTEFRRKILRGKSGMSVFLLDEPASNLHPSAQQNMIGDFHTLISDTILVYTTHSQHLIDESNIHNTYIVMRENGSAKCVRWGDYLTQEQSKEAYYQPLYDLLRIVPNSFTVPWKEAIIVEGVSDAWTIEFAFKVMGKKKDFVVYPAGSARNMSSLLSLNQGWGSNYCILLDGDVEGSDSRDEYKDKFGISDEQFIELPKDARKPEELFSNASKLSLINQMLSSSHSKITKKNLRNAIRLSLSESKENISSILDEQSVKNLEELTRICEEFFE